jgi:hypothetical protein
MSRWQGRAAEAVDTLPDMRIHTPRPFNDDSPRTSARRDQVVTSKKETSFCVSPSCLKKRLEASTKVQTADPFGVYFNSGSYTP